MIYRQAEEDFGQDSPQRKTCQFLPCFFFANIGKDLHGILEMARSAEKFFHFYTKLCEKAANAKIFNCFAQNCVEKVKIDD